ncbi:MAG: hypothetical protein WB762_30940 [Candidatus Sulfotelmatobacter sp.]
MQMVSERLNSLALAGLVILADRAAELLARAIFFQIRIGVDGEDVVGMASISRSQMALPKAQSGGELRTERRA